MWMGMSSTIDGSQQFLSCSSSSNSFSQMSEDDNMAPRHLPLPQPDICRTDIHRTDIPRMNIHMTRILSPKYIYSLLLKYFEKLIKCHLSVNQNVTSQLLVSHLSMNNLSFYSNLVDF